MMTLAERVQGCLVGGAIGDCLGAPHEGAVAGINLAEQLVAR